MVDRWRRGGEWALACFCFLLWCAGVAVAQVPSTCRVTFGLDPPGGSTIPGGQTRFAIRGLTRTSCAWAVKPALDRTRAGVTMTFLPAPGFNISPNSLGSGTAVVQVAPDVPPGTYELRVRLDLLASFGGATATAAPQYFTYTLQVTGNGGPGSLEAELTVDRGCGASYRIGEGVVISYRTSRDAVVTLRNQLPDGTVRLLASNQTLPGGVLQSVGGTVGEPPGTRRLILEAVAGDLRRQVECSFVAVRDLPGGALKAQLGLDQGCLEDGLNAVYFVGDPIEIHYQVDGAARPLATIANLNPDGTTEVILQQTIDGGKPYSVTGEIGPRLGRLGLRLTGQAGALSAQATCSHYVQDLQSEVELRLHLVKVTNAQGGSKSIAGRLTADGLGLTLEARQFLQALEGRLGTIWGQVKLRFRIDAVEELQVQDATSFGSSGVFLPTVGGQVSGGAREMFDFQTRHPGVLHVFLVESLGASTPGTTISRDAQNNTRDVREEARTPGNAVLLLADTAFLPTVSRFGIDSLSRTAEESLAEFLAHELGHGLGLPDIDAGQSNGSWRNLMWADPLRRVGTLLGGDSPGATFGLARGQTKQARATATGLKGKEPQ